MSDTAMVPERSGDQEPPRPPVIDPELADQLLARAEAAGWSCWARMGCCPR